MAKIQQEEKWYSGAIDLCFDPAENVKESAFLRIFAAPMCAPCNSNFGKAKAERKPSTVSKSMRRQGEEIYRDQQILLGEFEAYLKNGLPEGDNVKQRVDALAYGLVMNLLGSEDEYLKKNQNYKPKSYLSIFLSGQEAESRNLFYRVAEFYADALSLVFGSDESLETRSGLLQRQLEGIAPGFYIPERYKYSGSRRLGYSLCAWLILSAAQSNISGDDCDRLYRLLGLTPPEAGGTLSVLSVENITMKAVDFGLICTAALRSPLELDEIEAVFRTLKWVRSKVDGHLDAESRVLVEQFIGSISDFYQRKTKEMMSDIGSFDQLVAQIGKAKMILETCKGWLC